MLKRFVSFSLSFAAVCAVAAVCAAIVPAQQSSVTISVARTRANDGKQMYANYCASCHGVDGRSRGATAVGLNIAPTDLSTLSRNNHGAYPALHVAAVLKFGIESPGHGSKEMPVWGNVLRDVNGQGSENADIESMRITNLVRYVETLQAK